MYNPRNKNTISIKARALASESLSSYIQTRTTRSATESIDDPEVESTVSAEVKEYLSSIAYSAINDAKVFFSEDSAAAYDEMMTILASEEVKQSVIERLEQEKQTLDVFDPETEPEKYAQVNESIRYNRARRVVEGVQAEAEALQSQLRCMKKDIQARYPGLISDEE